MSRYVVTGGAGLIGSAVVRALIETPGAIVSLVDDLSSGKLENLDEVLRAALLHRGRPAAHAGLVPAQSSHNILRPHGCIMELKG